MIQVIKAERFVLRNLFCQEGRIVTMFISFKAVVNKIQASPCITVFSLTSLQLRLFCWGFLSLSKHAMELREQILSVCPLSSCWEAWQKYMVAQWQWLPVRDSAHFLCSCNNPNCLGVSFFLFVSLSFLFCSTQTESFLSYKADNEKVS